MNLVKELDYKINDVNKRLDKVKEIINNNSDKLVKYFDENFKLPESQKDDLSDKDTVCQQLEKIANYLLYVPGGEWINKNNVIYNFYTEEKFEKLLGKEPSIDEMAENYSQEELNDDAKAIVIDFLIRKGNNYKKQIKQKIFAEDIKNIKEIKDYQDYINSLRITLAKLKGKKKNIKQQKLIVKHMSMCKDDQILCKDKLLGTIYFKDVLSDTTDIDYDQFDFFDKEHVEALLKCMPRNMTSDLGLLLYDLEQLLKHVKLNAREKEILRLYRENDMSINDIAEYLGVKQQYVSNDFNNIVEKIINVYEDVYEDWYYREVVCGKYKKCSKCEKIKIANERHFTPDHTRKDGFFPYCKKCNK